MVKIYTLAELIEITEGQLVSQFGLTSPVLARGVVRILARVVAAVVWLLQGLVESANNNIFATTADIQLELIGYEVGVYRKQASYARGTVIMLGDNGLVPAGTIVQRQPDLTEYRTIDDVVIDGGSGSVGVVALVAGVASNAVINTDCNVPGFGVECYFSVAAVGGADIEDIESYRARVIYREQNPPAGGSVADYKIWCESIAGVTDAFPVANTPSVGSVYIALADYTNPNNPVVSDDVVSATNAYINSDRIRPLTARVQAASVQLAQVSITMQATPNTTAITSAMTAEIKTLLRYSGTPGSTITKITIISAAMMSGARNIEIVSLRKNGVEVEQLEIRYFEAAVLSGLTVRSF